MSVALHGPAHTFLLSPSFPVPIQAGGSQPSAHHFIKALSPEKYRVFKKAFICIELTKCYPFPGVQSCIIFV